MRLKDADESMEKVRDIEGQMTTSGFLVRLNAVLKTIKDQPAVDAVEVVHGEWNAKDIMARSPLAKNYYCSECREETNETSNYCPHCGAKMDGKKVE